MDHQNLNTTGSYKRSYSCALYSDEALFERDNMPLCYPVLNTSHIPSTDKAIECPGPGIYDGILDRDSNIASDATHSRGSAPTLLVQQPTASDKHIPWPSDEIAGYGGMERIYGYPPMLQQQLSYSQKEDQQIRVTCHYNILEYACGHSTPHPTLPYITHIDTCHHLALNIPNMACQNMGIASMSTSTRLCNNCIKTGRETKVHVEEPETSGKSKIRSNISMAGINTNTKEEEKYKFRWNMRSEAENTEAQKVKEAHGDSYEGREDDAREKGTKMSEILRRASVLRESRLKLMQDGPSQGNDSVSAKPQVTLASGLPHRNIRKEGVEDAKTKEKWWLQRFDIKEAANTQLGQSKESKGKSSSKIFSMPKEKAESTNPHLTNSSMPELVDTRLEDKGSVGKFSAGVPLQFISKSTNMSATEMLKGIHEKDVKLSMTEWATRAPALKPSMFNSSAQKQSTKPNTTFQGSHTQPRKSLYVSQGTQTMGDVASTKAIANESKKRSYVSQGTQTLEGVAADVALFKALQSQARKSLYVSQATQTVEEGMDLDKGTEAEDADWEFVNM